MDSTTLGKVLERRFEEERRFRQAYYALELKLSDHFPRGPHQREMCRIAGMPWNARHMTTINRLMVELGYKLVKTSGFNYYRKIDV